MNSPAAFDLVKEDLRLVEEKMRSQADGDSPILQAALQHLLKSGGKRLRPSLTLLTGGMLGGNSEQIITLAASIELLHTATLVHDDLIDGSLLRRGIPTLNSQWSPAATVLTGDYLFARAAHLAAEGNSLPAMRLFAQTLAVIVNGEVSQMFSRFLGESGGQREAYHQRIHAKTASLFETATGVAALVCPVDESAVAAVRRFGYQVGMAFQIVDDVLDFTGDQATVGKPVGSDLRQGLTTLPTILYCESLPEKEREAVLRTIETQNQTEMDALVDAVRRSSACARALDEAHAYIASGVEALAALPSGPEKQALEELAHYIVERRL